MPARAMVATSKRLEFLLKATGSDGSDPLPWYMLAMEFRSLSRHDEALETFEKLRLRSPEYVPMYLMCGQMLETMGRVEDARVWLSAGIDVARKRGDGHALGELEGALAAL
jgi:hypothetical protein